MPDPRFKTGSPLVEFDPNLPPGALNMDRILFLDVDGVLHPEGCGSDMEMCFALNFCEVIEKVDPQGLLPIVLSSAWRFDGPLEMLREQLLAPRLRRQMVGVTPDLHEAPSGGWTSTGSIHQGGRRQREIERWMRTYAPGGQWLAIDDRADGFEDNCPCLFLVPDVYEENGGGINATLAIDLQDRLEAFLGSGPKSRPHKGAHPS